VHVMWRESRDRCLSIQKQCPFHDNNDSVAVAHVDQESPKHSVLPLQEKSSLAEMSTNFASIALSPKTSRTLRC